MLDFEEWKGKFYQPRQPQEEDESQDPRDMRRMLLEDQKEQYAKYVALHEPEARNVAASVEEDRVVQQLAKLTNSKVVQPVVQREKSCATKKDAKWWREYRLRNKIVKCVHCGKDPKK